MVNSWVAGLRLNQPKTPSGFSENRTKVPPARGRAISSKVTIAVLLAGP